MGRSIKETSELGYLHHSLLSGDLWSKLTILGSFYLVGLVLAGGMHSTEVAFALLTQRPGFESLLCVNSREIEHPSSAYARDFANTVSGSGLSLIKQKDEFLLKFMFILGQRGRLQRSEILSDDSNERFLASDGKANDHVLVLIVRPSRFDEHQVHRRSYRHRRLPLGQARGPKGRSELLPVQPPVDRSAAGAQSGASPRKYPDVLEAEKPEKSFRQPGRDPAFENDRWPRYEVKQIGLVTPKP